MFLEVTLYNLQVVFGILMFLFALKKYPDIVRVDANQVIRFLASILFISVIQAFILSRTSIFTYIDTAYFQGVNSLAGVWWEDSCFVLPYLIAYRIFGKKAYFLFPLFVITSYEFMLGHSYQGITGCVTFLFPFVSFYYGRKHGSGTVMLCHIIYDTTLVMCLSGLRHLFAGIL